MKHTIKSLMLQRQRLYGTAQMQLHTRVCTGFLHACENVLRVTCDGVLSSLTYCTCVLHEGLHTHMCYLSGYKLATSMYVCVLFVCMCNKSINVDTFTKHLYT